MKQAIAVYICIILKYLKILETYQRGYNVVINLKVLETFTESLNARISTAEFQCRHISSSALKIKQHTCLISI